MKPLSHGDAYQVLCLQAADNGRGPVLFGDSFARAKEAALPFMVGETFPCIYLEFPLIGEPFLDVTVLYDHLTPHTRVDAPAAHGSEGMLDWFATAVKPYADVTCGFELDTKFEQLPPAAVHFQPRQHLELVQPFCAAIGEPERAQLYLDLADRMPGSWPLSFFGLFRGRPGSPLRICGYLDKQECHACIDDPSRLPAVFNQIGFTAYDDTLLTQARELLGTKPLGVDFQFDVYPDGTLGDTFAFDVQFKVETTAAVEESFTNGPGARAMDLLGRWGIADERRNLIPDAAFARGLPVQYDDGREALYKLAVMPGWVKVRWSKACLQPSKFYFYVYAGTDDEPFAPRG